MQYTVIRAHLGDKWYNEGDPRELSEAAAQHLIGKVLIPASPVPHNKAAHASETKASPLAGGQTGKAKPVQSSQAAPEQRKRASKQPKGAAE